MAIDREILTAKCNDLRTYFIELRPLLALPANDILHDHLKLRTIERDFQLLVDTMLDINSHLITAHNLPVPDTYQNTFTVLAQHSLLSKELALQLAPIVGLRNKIVHKYGEIDLKQFLADLREGSQQFETYRKEIQRFL